MQETLAFQLVGQETPKVSAAGATADIKSTYTEELVLALCGPIGSPIHKVAEAFKTVLAMSFGYDCTIIKLSKFIGDDLGQTVAKSEYERINQFIDQGDKIREKIRPSYLAEKAIEFISNSRIADLPPIEKQKVDSADGAPIRFNTRRRCFLIDSIKNQEELDVLREVYRDLLYFVGVFSPRSKREEFLQAKGMKLYEAQRLIDKDAGGGDGARYGQTVRKTFPQADLFIRVDSTIDEPLRYKTARFLDLVFGTKIVTPSKEETAMYLAKASAGNSACLSRQVGACLTDSAGDVLSIGWNDVPKVGGHLYRYTESDKLGELDGRCMNDDGGKCHNDEEKSKLAQEIAERLIIEKLVKSNEREQVVKAILSTRLKGLIEFSRAIHAEMFALILAGENCGSRIKGGTLYCTTYPCHNCARHLIAAGVVRVFYIEPFPKSMATTLHADSITEDEKDEKKVRLLSFDGVSPNRYLRFFGDQQDRKSRARRPIRPSEARPKYEITLESLSALEGIIVKRLQETTAS
jgi:deoxycytidylate deaminase